MPFTDAYFVIEQRLGFSIRSFFEREGEEAFLDIEESVIADLCTNAEGGIATGGGAVLRAANRERLKSSGHVVYLRSTPEDVFKRVRHDKGRPLLQVDDPMKRLRELYAARDPLYRETAHFVIETGRPSVPTLANMILMQLELAGIVPPRA